ncbi:MAG: hypothetical protein J0I20_04070 [Chloroflexi bacterium]|nr:hypothetical protein [Chloroflexota bacterium]OJW04285.1 MAG: hypothetical protein BGO39_10990 [Chloroflexi bacterium 54-19]
MNGSQALGYLARKDKWFLGGGKKVIWAPEFPLWLEQPGFWDHACYLDYRVGPLFTVTLVDERGREVSLSQVERYWQPDHSSQLYRERAHGLTVQERRALLPLDVLASSFEISHQLDQEKTYDLILWTAQERFESQGIFELDGGKARPQDSTVLWRRRVRDSRVPRNPQNDDEGVLMRFAVAVGANRTAASFSIKTSDRQPNYPRWTYSPFYEKLAEHGGLGNETPGHLDPDFGGLTYFGLHYKVTLPPNGRAAITFFAAIAGSEEEALVNLRVARRREDLSHRQPLTANFAAEEPDPSPVEMPDRDRRPTYPAKRHWREYFEGVPDFTCSDPYLQKYYWYRWYGLRLNTIRAGDDERLSLPYPCVFEGINLGWFRQPITYSAQCHMLETKWLHDPALAQGSLLNFVVNQLEDGSFPGVVKNIYRDKNHPQVGVAFYHANWGLAVRELHRVHPDRVFLERVYKPLSDYLRYFNRVRDSDETGLYDVINMWETGQEFMSRYQQVDPEADKGGNLRLKGVDATVYIYELQQTLAWMAGELGRPEAGQWQELASRTRRAVRQRMWNPETEFFHDVNPATGERISAKAAVGFYPFMAEGLAGPEHLNIFRKHLFNEAEFWTPYPVPTTSKDDSTYSAGGEWQGQRLVCPWNGRSWLMTNSHVAESLARAALNFDSSLQPKAVELINRFIKMLFLDGNVDTPSSYEYYNPLTGQAPFFRGTEDYMHSWIADLIIKYVAGVQPGDGGRVWIRPLPFDLDYFTLDRLKVAGHWLKITWRKSDKVAWEALNQPNRNPVGLTVWVDGELVAARSRLEPFEISLV